MATPVKPIQQLGTTTQRAIEEFRLDYNTSLASQPKAWVETLGDVLTGDSLKDTYPITLDSQKYREKKGETHAETIGLESLTIIKREFYSSAIAEARRIKRGDHAYIQAWGRKSEAMARGRVFLRNHIVADLLAAGATTTCFDGVYFFAANHPVNPTDKKKKTKAGATTWSNYQSSATPLNAINLTAEKTAFKMVPGPDGEELGQEADIVLVPSSLDEGAYNLLKVQDLILSGALDGAGGGTMGTVRNPHFNRPGLSHIRAPELPGVDATADWYLLSSTALGNGVPPWVLSEDPSDELVEWNEDSDFYKDTKQIKIESTILLEAALLFPHAVRKIKGA
jgi:phage major head subunit gpT-like protein